MINATNAGVNAIILNDGTDINPYRLVLTNVNTGEQNDIQITENVTQLDFTNKIIEAATSDTTNSGSYTGAVTSNVSEYYTGTNNKTYIIETITAGTVGALFVTASGPFQRMAVPVPNAMGRGLMNVPYLLK